MSKTLTPAVSYIRMSSDLQEASPDQQRAEVVKLAAKLGYKITREYFDESISGDATEKRTAFLKMIKDAEEKADFAAILCWDQDRFGRFDSIEAGRWIHPLRCAGVWLVTVAQGQIDWNDFASRMVYSVVPETSYGENFPRRKMANVQVSRPADMIDCFTTRTGR
ncbi:MAG: recombinase family protein [Thermoguttaceae bacterium]